MSKADFDMTGLEELSSKLMAAVEDFPGTAEKGLITIGNKLKKECVKNTPEGSTGKLKKGWKHKVEGYNGSELVYELINKHPVHHLLNNGHANTSLHTIKDAVTCTCQQKLDTKLKKSGIKNESMYKIHQLF